MCNLPALFHYAIISLDGMSVGRQHQTHNQSCNLQPDKQTHTNKPVCEQKHTLKTSAGEIRRLQTGKDVIEQRWRSNVAFEMQFSCYFCVFLIL